MLDNLKQGDKRGSLFKAELRLAIMITLLVIIVAVTGIITYRNIGKLIKDVQKGTPTISNVAIIREIGGDLTVMESNVRSFFFTRDSSYLEQYDSTQNKIRGKIVLIKTNHSMKQVSVAQLDSLAAIVDGKFEVFNEWLALAHNLEVTKTLSIIPKKLKDLKEKDAVVDDGDYVGAFKIKNKKKREKLKQESNRIDLDDVTKEVTAEVSKVKKQQTEFLTDLDQKTALLNERSRALTAKLRSIISVLEKEEKVELAENNARAIRKAEITNLIIATFSISSIALLVIIGLVLYRYTVRTNSYNRALRKARIEAEGLAMAKQNFLANMTHELRTPINSIVGFSELLEKSDLTPDQKEQLSIVKKSSMHLLKVVNEVLDFSKLQAGKFNFEKIIFEPQVTIGEVVEILSPEAAGKRIKLQFQLEQDLPQYLVGDPFRLQQILLNIIGNAIKFTGSGSVMVHVTSEKLDELSCMLKIEVKDTGIGIPEDYTNRVFDEFEQADNKVDSKYRGTGLGLSISKKLVELQNGSINIYSKLGEGTVVNIIMPYQLSSEGNLQYEMEAATDTSFLLHKKILVVDDEKYNRMLLKRLFNNWGVTVTEAENGMEAIGLIKHNHWDLVLMDIRMPEISGIEAVKIVRSSYGERLKNLPIIALTASNDKEKEQECLDAGMSAFVSKPFTEQKLLGVLGQFLKHSEVKRTIEQIEIADEDFTNGKVNIDELMKLSNGDKKFVHDMVELFIKSTKDGLKKMDEGFATSDFNMIRDQAHKISSPCRHLGADALYSCLKAIENHFNTPVDKIKLENEINQAKEEAYYVFRELEQSIT